MTRARIAVAYDGRADEYIELMGAIEQMAPRDRTTIEDWRDHCDGRLLDAGCGPGHWTELLTDHGGRDAVVLDGSACFLASARRRFPRTPFVAGDLSALPLASGSLGGILAWYSIIHTPPPALPAMLEEFARALAPGGSLLLGFFDGEPAVAFAHAVTTAYFWSAEALTDLLGAAGFMVERSASRHDHGVRRRHGELLARRVSATGRA